MPTRSNPGCFRDIPISPMTGHMDLRSPNGLCGLGNWRLVLNVAAVEVNKPCRMGGWRRLFASDSFWNEDLHDDLLCFSQFYDAFTQTDYTFYDGFYDTIYCGTDLNTRDGCREPKTLLVEFETDSSRKLIAASESRIYELNEGIGNWRIIALCCQRRVPQPSHPRRT